MIESSNKDELVDLEKKFKSDIKNRELCSFSRRIVPVRVPLWILKSRISDTSMGGCHDADANASVLAHKMKVDNKQLQ